MSNKYLNVIFFNQDLFLHLYKNVENHLLIKNLKYQVQIKKKKIWVTKKTEKQNKINCKRKDNNYIIGCILIKNKDIN